MGDSVRTVGRLKSVLSVETVVIEDEGFELEVDVSLSTPCHFKPGSQYQFIGELEDRRNSMGNDVSQHVLSSHHVPGTHTRTHTHMTSLALCNIFLLRSQITNQTSR